MDSKEFGGKVAIVTGTTGIGKAIAKRLAAGGAQVIVGVVWVTVSETVLVAVV